MYSIVDKFPTKSSASKNLSTSETESYMYLPLKKAARILFTYSRLQTYEKQYKI